MKIQNLTSYNIKSNTSMNFKSNENVSQPPIEKISVSKAEYDKLKTEHDQFISSQKKEENKDLALAILLVSLLTEK